jgi:hypothetical protein
MAPFEQGLLPPGQGALLLVSRQILGWIKKLYEAEELKFPGQIEELKAPLAFKRFLTHLYHQAWVVYCKPPLKHPEKVMDYLGRYTHRVALSNDRLVKMEDNRVTFRWRDSADNDKIKLLTLEAFEFIRQILACVRPADLGYFFGSTLSYDLSAFAATSGTHVDYPSAFFTISMLCSMTMTVLPESTSWLRV